MDIFMDIKPRLPGRVNPTTIPPCFSPRGESSPAHGSQVPRLPAARRGARGAPVGWAALAAPSRVGSGAGSKRLGGNIPRLSWDQENDHTRTYIYIYILYIYTI